MVPFISNLLSSSISGIHLLIILTVEAMAQSCAAALTVLADMTATGPFKG